MYKKILKINIFVFVLIFTSILVAAQSDKDSIVKVYVPDFVTKKTLKL